MIRQTIYLPKWKWECDVFYDATSEDMPEILQRIREIGCGRLQLFKARTALSTRKPNTGLTFTSFKDGRSVMVIGYTSSADEFQNTFDHEKGHLARHICLALDVDPYGEEAQYLAGEIGQKMFPVARRFMCGCEYGQR